jgi:hypothetical protein
VPLGYAGIAEDAPLGAGVDGDGTGVDGDGLALAGDGVGLEGCGLEDDGLGVEVDGLGADADGLGIEADGNFFGSGILFAVGEGPLEGDGLTPSLAEAFGVGEVGAGLPNTVSAERVVSLTFSSCCSGFLGLVASWLCEPAIGMISNNRCSPIATVTEGLSNFCQDQVEFSISSNSSNWSRI